MSNKSFWISVSLILLLAAFLRFWHLCDQGFHAYDEGWLIENAERSAQEWIQGGLRSYNNFKSSHTTWASLVLSLRMFGVSAAPIQYPFALYGLLGVLGLMWLASEMYGRQTALIGGAFLATSPMHTYHSRSVSIEAPGVAFLLLSYALMYGAARSARSRRGLGAGLLAGAAMGLAITANYRVLACLPLPLLMAVVLARPWRRWAITSFSFVVGLGVVLLVWDRFLAHTFPASHGYFESLFYTDVTALQASLQKGSTSVLDRVRVVDVGFYLRALWDLGNPAFVVLAGLGVLLLVVGAPLGVATSEDVTLCLLIGVPALEFTMLVFKAPRVLSVVEPLVALMAARLVSRLLAGAPQLSRFRTARVTVAVVGITVTIGLGLAGSLSEDVTGRSNAFREAFKTVASHGPDGVIVVLDRFVPDFYARETKQRITRLGQGCTLADVVRKSNDGYRYWLVDGQFAVFQSFFRYVWPAFESLQPSVLVPAPHYIRPAHFLEHAEFFGASYDRELQYYREWTARWGRNLPMYDLGKLVGPLPWDRAGTRWYHVGSGIVALVDSHGGQEGYDVAVEGGPGVSAVRTRVLFDYNREPLQGGIALLAGSGEQMRGVVFYWELERERRQGFLAQVRDGQLTPLGAKVPLQFDQDPRLSITWANGVVSGFVNDRAVLNVDDPQPEEPLRGGLVASKEHLLEVSEFAVERIDRGK